MYQSARARTNPPDPLNTISPDQPHPLEHPLNTISPDCSIEKRLGTRTRKCSLGVGPRYWPPVTEHPSSTGRPAIRRLAVARLTSAGGTHAARTALVFEIYDRTNSTRWVTAVLLADMATSALLGPVAGWVGDHVDRRRVMIVSEVAAAVAYLALAFVHAPLLLVIGSALATAVNSPFLPTSSASIPNLVDEADLRWANSQMSLSSNGALIIGPMVGGWLLALTNLGVVFTINAVSFVASAYLIRKVSGTFKAHDQTTQKGMANGLRAGYRIIVTNKVIRGVTIALAMTHFTFGLALVADPVLADDFGAGPIGYALLYSTWGVVALLGAWLAGRRFPSRLVPFGIIGGLAAVATACVAISVLPWFWAIVAVGSLGGVGSGVLFPLTTGLIQQHAPDEVRARVFGAIETFDRSMYAVGMLIAAPLVANIGPQPTYRIVALVVFGAALSLLRLPAALRHSLSSAPTSGGPTEGLERPESQHETQR